MSNNEKSAVLQWAENNQTIFAELREIDCISAEMRKVPWWDVWKNYKLDRQYKKHLTNLLRMSHYNNQMLRASLL